MTNSIRQAVQTPPRAIASFRLLKKAAYCEHPTQCNVEQGCDAVKERSVQKKQVWFGYNVQMHERLQLWTEYLSTNTDHWSDLS